MSGMIAALGGWWGEAERALPDFILDLSGKERPRVLYVPTAKAEDAAEIVDFYEELSGRAEVSVLRFFPWPPPELRAIALAQDVIWVSGGNTANMLAIWRAHGFDGVLRDAWEAGVVLTGASAGAICWFEASVTDSFGPQLEAMRDGLGLLAGSCCPHYDSEELRRPVYTKAVREGRLPPGLAADDGVALLYEGRSFVEAVTARPGARAWRVTVDGEEPIEPRLL